MRFDYRNVIKVPVPVGCHWEPVAHPGPDDYQVCPPEFDLCPAGDRRMVTAKAVRTGITPPFTPNRGVYLVEVGVKGSVAHRVYADPYVYEAGRLVPLAAWVAANPVTEEVIAEAMRARKKNSR